MKQHKCLKDPCRSNVVWFSVASGIKKVHGRGINRCDRQWYPGIEEGRVEGFRDGERVL